MSLTEYIQQDEVSILARILLKVMNFYGISSVSNEHGICMTHNNFRELLETKDES